MKKNESKDSENYIGMDQSAGESVSNDYQTVTTGMPPPNVSKLKNPSQHKISFV